MIQPGRNALPLALAAFVSAALLSGPLFAQVGSGDGSGLLADAEARTVAAEIPLEDLVELVRDSPFDAVASFNLGLREARAGHLGASVLLLERAHYLRPFDREIGDALMAVRMEARRRRAEAIPDVTITEGEPSVVYWWRLFGAVPRPIAVWSVLVFVWAAGAIVLLRRRAPGGTVQDVLAVAAGCALAFAALASTFWWGGAYTWRHAHPGVVVSEEPRVHEGPDDLAGVRSEADLYEGAVVLIREERAGWRLVELVTGERVWVDDEVVAGVF